MVEDDENHGPQLCQCGYGERFFYYPGISQPSATRHLNILHRAELIDWKRIGTRVFYSQDLQAIDEYHAHSGVYTLNLMALPGAGKTSVIIRTMRLLKEDPRMAVIDGDVESIADF